MEQTQEQIKLEQSTTITIDTNARGVLTIVLNRFAAMDGLDFRKRFRDYCTKSDTAMRNQFLVEVLDYAQVVDGEQAVPLNTMPRINEYCENWQNLQHILNEILRFNGVDVAYEQFIDKERAAAEGALLAEGLVARAIKLFGDFAAFESDKVRALIDTMGAKQEG